MPRDCELVMRGIYGGHTMPLVKLAAQNIAQVRRRMRENAAI